MAISRTSVNLSRFKTLVSITCTYLFPIKLSPERSIALFWVKMFIYIPPLFYRVQNVLTYRGVSVRVRKAKVFYESEITHAYFFLSRREPSPFSSCPTLKAVNA